MAAMSHTSARHEASILSETIGANINVHQILLKVLS